MSYDLTDKHEFLVAPSSTTTGNNNILVQKLEVDDLNYTPILTTNWGDVTTVSSTSTLKINGQPVPNNRFVALMNKLKKEHLIVNCEGLCFLKTIVNSGTVYLRLFDAFQWPLYGITQFKFVGFSSPKYLNGRVISPQNLSPAPTGTSTDPTGTSIGGTSTGGTSTGGTSTGGTSTGGTSTGGTSTGGTSTGGTSTGGTSTGGTSTGGTSTGGTSIWGRTGAYKYITYLPLSNRPNDDDGRFGTILRDYFKYVSSSCFEMVSNTRETYWSFGGTGINIMDIEPTSDYVSEPSGVKIYQEMLPGNFFDTNDWLFVASKGNQGFAFYAGQFGLNDFLTRYGPNLVYGPMSGGFSSNTVFRWYILRGVGFVYGFLY